MKHFQTFRNIMKHFQTFRNIMKHFQTFRNIMKHFQVPRLVCFVNRQRGLAGGGRILSPG